jgi:ubiquinone/menaquinone biosynthesis C-methylase UbiE
MPDMPQSAGDETLKEQVRDFWDAQSCGEVYASGDSEQQYYESQSKLRFELEPYILEFARFSEGVGKDLLEIGVGMGADHVQWARSGPRKLTGVDLTPRAVNHTQRRLEVLGLHSNVQVADAENLPFPDNSFDLVYSWGVLHHSPNTQQAINEVHRVLRPCGIARIMIYHKYSLVAYMLWMRYGLLTGRPSRSLDYIHAHYLESPGTKAFTTDQARTMCQRFSKCNVCTRLAFGDLLEGAVGQRHRGLMLSTAKALLPRWLIRRVLRNHGQCLFIEAVK